jgi:hypothetical protein
MHFTYLLAACLLAGIAGLHFAAAHLSARLAWYSAALIAGAIAGLNVFFS